MHQLPVQPGVDVVLIYQASVLAIRDDAACLAVANGTWAGGSLLKQYRA